VLFDIQIGEISMDAHARRVVDEDDDEEEDYVSSETRRFMANISQRLDRLHADGERTLSLIEEINDRTHHLFHWVNRAMLEMAKAKKKPAKAKAKTGRKTSKRR
jgi:hypothetical protein